MSIWDFYRSEVQAKPKAKPHKLELPKRRFGNCRICEKFVQLRPAVTHEGFIHYICQRCKGIYTDTRYQKLRIGEIRKFIRESMKEKNHEML